MTEQEVYDRLSKEARKGYRVNELIRFTYPARELRLSIIAAKPLERSLESVYRVVLQAIRSGFDTRELLYDVLGLSPTDEFIQRELFGLRERGLINLVSSTWRVEQVGLDFMADPSLIREETEDRFYCFVDRITGKPFTLRDENLLDTPATKTLAPSPNDPPRFSGQLLEGISNDVKRIYDRTNDNGSVLTGYAPEPVERDYERWLDRWLIEYIPEPGETGTPRLEVRKVHELELDKRLTERFSSEPELLLALTDSDRMEDVVEQLVVSPEPIPTAAPSQAPEPSSGKGTVKPSMEPLSLTIWETKEQFVKALSTVNYRLLIESPWIKRATIEYLPRFRDVLEKGNELVILYGIGIKDEHDTDTVRMLERLADEYPEQFRLCHLPSHLRRIGHPMTGTHRKLVIKDDEYYMLGSFNFLSMGQKEGQRVANEQALLVSSNVDERWRAVLEEYGLEP